MVRKQLYISETQELMLKGRSRALGVSEAELVRRALDSVLSDADTSLMHPRAGNSVQAFIDEAEGIAGKVAIRPPGRREDLYAERIEGLAAP